MHEKREGEPGESYDEQRGRKLTDMTTMQTVKTVQNGMTVQSGKTVQTLKTPRAGDRRMSERDPARSPRRTTRTLLGALLLLALGAGPHAAGAPGVADSVPRSAPARAGGGGEQSLETFVPSEKVPADSAVSFPVDI